MKKRIKFAVLASAILLLGTPVVSSNVMLDVSPVETAQAATNSQTEAVTKAIKTELNNLRGQNNLGSLSGVYELTKMAQSRADHLANINSLDEHAGYNYQSGAPYVGVAGENIGYWYNSRITDPTEIAKQIIEDLYDDSGVATYGHRKNMLNPYFKHVGVAVSVNPSNGYLFYAQDFGSTTTEVGDNYNGAKAYSDYTRMQGLSNQYPSTYHQTSSTTANTNSGIFNGAKKINSVVTTTALTPLYSSPSGGKKSNRALAPNSGWYTDQVFTDQYGNNWYRVSTSEWAPINHANIQNI
ncbi:CAP domain-containing protein [Companilactobacillus ginsenosidimutans]|uniref:SCP domain-containing protein n=1 Tax=Companilactobacillus ginsenosidimutans TaxID=1007676 RepID=A0A0H4QE95_9LACO|nr:CAP domain-containing protein [Companilactobacillus ginsenosidimutans]AKP66262.1 hypothetical protein ABM34_00995 [Companilactobacillus ginsenosidimutans]